MIICSIQYSNIEWSEVFNWNKIQYDTYNKEAYFLTLLNG